MKETPAYGAEYLRALLALCGCRQPWSPVLYMLEHTMSHTFVRTASIDYPLQRVFLVTSVTVQALLRWHVKRQPLKPAVTCPPAFIKRDTSAWEHTGTFRHEIRPGIKTIIPHRAEMCAMHLVQPCRFLYHRG